MQFCLFIKQLAAFLTLLIFFTLTQESSAEVLTRDTVWQGDVRVAEDVLVPAGVTLTVRPGTRVLVVASESTKTDPEYLSPLTEITVRGTLRVEGTSEAPVLFSGEEPKSGSWAGIIVDRGLAEMRWSGVRDAETGVTVLDGRLAMGDSSLRENRYGLVVQGGAGEALLENSPVTANDYGAFLFQGGRLTTRGGAVSGNRKRDAYTAPVRKVEAVPPATVPAGAPARHYLNEVALGETVWQGRVRVAGLVRVPEGSRLVVLPGTVVEFTRRDTNGDGIGENGLLIQGRLIAKGTRERPIVFRSAEPVRRMGDWDSINIMNSGGTPNLLEHCRIEDAYRGLHFHFSHVMLLDSVLLNNYRGIQFQESLVELRGNRLAGNRSGVQGRDSDITFLNNTIADNYVGANFFRSTISARGNRVTGNWREGWRIREGVSNLQDNLIDGNRQGLLLADMFYGSYQGNSLLNNLETGASLKNTVNLDISGNLIAGNGITGISIQESQAMVRGNQITDNGERGIGVLSFDGIITGNNLAANGRYAVDLDGTGDVAAPLNWWGGEDPEKVVLDKRSDPKRGTVQADRPRPEAFPFTWPLVAIDSDVTWRGVLGIGRDVALMQGATLTVAPGTRVEFSPGTGMLVKGRMLASGTPRQKIVFTSRAGKGSGSWGEIQLEYATGSVVSHCVFEHATWGLHSHFTNLVVSDSLFTGNSGGMRFRSGPVQIRNSAFEENGIGIRAYLGNAVISGNDIRRNETGIFVREKGGGLLITGNNLTDNSNYNIRVGDFNNEDVPAPGNWWGTSDPTGTIFDGRNEPGIGNVLFDPVLQAPAAAGGVR